MRRGFEADLCPETGAPRLRWNFANGWSGSLVMRNMAPNGCDAPIASVAACPSGHWGEGLTEPGPTEATADEAIAWIAAVAQRPSVLLGGAKNRFRFKVVGEAGK